MHACGHDGHAATLFAAAAWLKNHEDRLPGPVSLLFQPAEEGGHGAKRMIEDGALEGVDAIFGWHNWPAIPYGKAVCPDGAVMAGNGTFEIEVKGQGGHSSQPEACRDPVLAGSAIVVALQQLVSRRLSPQTPRYCR
jgi:amidohydrolase